MYTTFNFIAVSLFLGASLVIGLWAGRGVKTMRDYAIANKNLFVGALMATMLATLFDTEIIELRTSYKNGVRTLFYPGLFLLVTFLLGVFVFPRLVHFKKELTLPDMMQTFYGKSARYVTAVIAVLFSLCIIMAQLIHFSELSALMGVSSVVSIAFLGFMVTFYTFLGGIRAVAKTDILQALVIIGGIVIFFIISKGGYNFKTIYQTIQIQNPNRLVFQKKLFASFVNACFWSLFPIMLISPPVIQRVLMTPTQKHIKNMFLAFIFVYAILRLLILGVGLKGTLIIGDIRNMQDKAGNSRNITDLFLVEKLCSPFGQTVFLLVVCAIAVSTMDSFLNAIAIIIVHDIITPYTKENNEKKIVKKTKMIALAFGVLCTLISVGYIIMLPTALADYTLSGGILVFSVITIPFLVGCMGFKGSRKAFFISAISYFTILTIFTILAFMQVYPFDSFSHFIAMNMCNVSKKIVKTFYVCIRASWYIAIIPSVMLFFVISYLDNKGFVFVNYTQGEWKERKHTFTSYFEKSFAIGNPAFVGYITLAFTLASVLIGYKNPQVDEILLLILRLIPLGLSFAIMTQGHWTNRLKPYFSKVYHVTLWYCWGFLPAFLAIADPQIASIFYAVAGIIFLGIQTVFPLFLVFATGGITVAMCINKMLTGVFFPDFGLYADWLFVFCVASVGFVMTIFRKLHQEKERLEVLNMRLKTARYGLLVTHEANNKQIYDVLHKNSYMMQEMQKRIDELQQIEEVDKKIVEELQDIMGYYNDIGQSTSAYLKINILTSKIEDILAEARSMLNYESLPIGVLSLENRSKVSELVCDPYQMKNLMVNAVHVFGDVYPEDNVTCWIEDVFLDYDVPEIYKKNPEMAIRFTFTNQVEHGGNLVYYRPYEDEKVVNTLNNINILENKRIINAHYGYIDIVKEGKTLVQTYVVPVNLKNIRPKIDRFVVEDLSGLEQIESDEDKRFLQLVEAHGFDKNRMREALKVAKHYHYGQFRKSGESYYLHPLAVATILIGHLSFITLSKEEEEDMIIAALLHDIFEDTSYELRQLKVMFGENVRNIVKDVSHLYKRSKRPKLKVGKGETLDVLIQNGNRVSLLVKLADRLHNMRTLEAKESDRQLAIATETENFFIPLAEKLGMHKMAKELASLVKGIRAV